MGSELEDAVYGALLFPLDMAQCCLDFALDCDQIQLVAVTVLGLDCSVTMQQLAGPAGYDFLSNRLGGSKQNLAANVMAGAGAGGLPSLPGVDPNAPPDEQLDQLLHTATDGVAGFLQGLTVLGMPEMADATLANFCPVNCRVGTENRANNIAYTPCSVAATMMGKINSPLSGVISVLRVAQFLNRRSDNTLLSCDTTPVEMITTIAPLAAAVASCLDTFPMTCGLGLQAALPPGLSAPVLRQLIDGLNNTAELLSASGDGAVTLAEFCPAICGKCNATVATHIHEQIHRETQTHPPSLLTVLYNSSFTHAAPVFLALGDSAIKVAKDGVGSSIRVHSHPLPWTYWEKNGSIYSVIVGIVQSLVVCLFVLIAFSFVPGALVEFSVREREHNHNAKHQQYVSGASIPAYWVANFGWDFCVFLIPALACLAMASW